MRASETAQHDAFFGALIATAVDGIVVIDAGGIVRVFNAASERLFGYTSSEIVGQNVKILMPEPYRAEHDGYVSNYQKTGEAKIIGIGRDVLGRRKNGTTFPMYLSVGKGEAAGERFFVGIIHDLSRMRAEQESRQALDRHLASIVESSDDVILSKALDGTIISWNAAASRIFGYTAREMIGQSIARIIPAGRRSEEDEILSQITAGNKIVHYETTRLRKDGSEIIVSLSVSPVYDTLGNVIGASKIARDITEQRRAQMRAAGLQAELAHVARVSAMGQLSSALAHELNQPLTAAMNYINAARRWLKSTKDVEKASPLLDKAVEQVALAGKIIQGLRRFLEKREVGRSLEDINEIVKEAVALGCVGATDDNIRVSLDLAVGLAPVYVDRVQIGQVIVNLVRNANEAMHDCAIRRLEIATSQSATAFIEIRVSDTGRGIPEEIAARLFEPFTTTKERGMGVGLSICRTILEAHSGRIWMTPNESGGATFRVQLPTEIEG